jgi:small GTP-binding protein
MKKLHFKICPFGEGGVGKTSIIQRFIKDEFRTDYNLTVGLDIFDKTLIVGDYEVKLVMFDIGGSSRSEEQNELFFKGAHAGVFIFDLTRPPTLNSIEAWLKLFREGSMGKNRNLPILMVGNKADLEGETKISLEEALDLLIKYELFGYMESSAKTGKNINELFFTLTEEIIKNYKFK